MQNALTEQLEDIRALACRAFNTVSDMTAISMFESVLDLTDDRPDASSRAVRRQELFGLLVDFRPRDGVERILAAQIVTAHTVAMDRLRRTNAPELSDRQRGVAFNQAMQALNMLARLTAQYDRHRAREIPPMKPDTVYQNGREYTIFVDGIAEPPEIAAERLEAKRARLRIKMDEILDEGFRKMALAKKTENQ